jgi:hypothetical protein
MLVMCDTHNTVMSNSMALFMYEGFVTLLTNVYVLHIPFVGGIFLLSLTLISKVRIE